MLQKASEERLAQHARTSILEQKLLANHLGTILKVSGPRESVNGPGINVLQMDISQPGIPHLWQPLGAVKDDDLSEFFEGVDCRHGVYGVVFVYPRTVSAYVINTNVGDGYAELTDQRFHVLRTHLVDGLIGPEGRPEDASPPGRRFRPGDLEDDSEFL